LGREEAPIKGGNKMTLREEMHSCIDAIATEKLVILRPLLLDFAGHYDVSSNLTDEEKDIISEEMENYKKHPEIAVKLEDID
jgi:hypothetical protein